MTTKRRALLDLAECLLFYLSLLVIVPLLFVFLFVNISNAVYLLFGWNNPWLLIGLALTALLGVTRGLTTIWRSKDMSDVHKKFHSAVDALMPNPTQTAPCAVPAAF